MTPTPHISQTLNRIAVTVLIYICFGSSGVILADDPVVVFRSMDDVRQALARWDAEEHDLNDREQIIEVQMGSDKPTLGLALDEDPLGPEVTKVVAGSAADLAGLKKGDHLKSIDKAKIDSVKDAALLVDRHPIATVMELEFRRNNYTYERRLRFLKPADADDQQGAPSRYLLDRVEELESKLSTMQIQNQRLRSAVRFLLEDREATE